MKHEQDSSPGERLTFNWSRHLSSLVCCELFIHDATARSLRPNTGCRVPIRYGQRGYDCQAVVFAGRPNLVQHHSELALQDYLGTPKTAALGQPHCQDFGVHQPGL